MTASRLPPLGAAALSAIVGSLLGGYFAASRGHVVAGVIVGAAVFVILFLILAYPTVANREVFIRRKGK